MNINSLIDRDYYAVSILEDMQQINEWLREKEYYAIIDENDCTVGIVTAQDLPLNPPYRLINCDTSKPKLSPTTTLPEAFQLMRHHRLCYLPVCEGHDFIGVVSVWSVTEKLFSLLDECMAVSALTTDIPV